MLTPGKNVQNAFAAHVSHQTSNNFILRLALAFNKNRPVILPAPCLAWAGYKTAVVHAWRRTVY